MTKGDDVNETMEKDKEETAIARVVRPEVALFGASDPQGIVDAATEKANVLAEVVQQKDLYKQIRDSRHVLVEGWTLLGTFLGVYPVVTGSRPIPEDWRERGMDVPWGWEASCEARTLAGAVVGAADAMCDRSESKWKNSDNYQIRSMAQTRATSKALRLPLGFVMSLAGFSATPYEEMEERGEAPANEGGGDPQGGISEGQMRAIHSAAAKIGLDHDRLSAGARTVFGVGSMNELTFDQASGMLTGLNKVAREMKEGKENRLLEDPGWQPGADPDAPDATDDSEVVEGEVVEEGGDETSAEELPEVTPEMAYTEDEARSVPQELWDRAVFHYRGDAAVVWEEAEKRWGPPTATPAYMTEAAVRVLLAARGQTA